MPRSSIRTSVRHRRTIPRVLVLCALCLPAVVFAAPGDTTLLSTTAAGEGIEGVVRGISPNGRFVLIQDRSRNMVPGGNSPGLVRIDTLLDTRVLVVWGDTAEASVSADGRYVAFSTQRALVAADTNQMRDIYVRDMETRALVRASVGPNGVQSNGWSNGAAISADGRYVLFKSGASNLAPNDTNGCDDAFVRDLRARVTELVSVGAGGNVADGCSWGSDITRDGRFVVFTSTAGDLVPGDTNQDADVFLRDRVLGTTQRVSVASSGGQSNGLSHAALTPGAVSDDGRYVSFLSAASNLVAGDTNGQRDTFIRDTHAGATERVSVSSTGAQVAAASLHGVVSNDGRYVAFISDATSLVPGDLNGADDLFVRDRVTRTTFRASVSSAGVQSNGATWEPAFISNDGTRVYFNNTGSNLVELPTPPGELKAYVHELGGSSSPTAAFIVDPNRYDFGNATIHWETAGKLILTNTGTAPVTIQGLLSQGADGALFRANHACGMAVAVGDACEVRVYFRPTTVGPRTATLSVITTAGAQDVELLGTGVPAQFTLSPTSIDFGSQPVGTRSDRRYARVRNTGLGVLPIRWVGIAGVDGADFGRTRGCPGVLEPWDVCYVEVWFAPTSRGDKSARLVVSPGDSGARRSVALSGDAR